MVATRRIWAPVPTTDAPPSLAFGERHLPERARGGRYPHHVPATSPMLRRLALPPALVTSIVVTRSAQKRGR